MTKTLLSVDNLIKYYGDEASILDRVLDRSVRPVKAVDGISFDIKEGETLGLVGESGCGKSTTGETILRLHDATSGAIRLEGEEITSKGNTDDFRKRVQIVFQDPFSSLDPRMTAGDIVREPLDIHRIGTKTERKERVIAMFEQVGLSESYLDRYPHEFSGGQRQRIGIARALVLEPDLIVLDEPVSALDVSVQAQILNLLVDLQELWDLTYLFIAHDLSVVRHISDRVAIMYLGEIVEIGPVEDIFERPKHPYTEKLLESVPEIFREGDSTELEPLHGDVPSPKNPPKGCRFHTRCPKARRLCSREHPGTVPGQTGATEHIATCFRELQDHEYWQSSHLERLEKSTENSS